MTNPLSRRPRRFLTLRRASLRPASLLSGLLFALVFAAATPTWALAPVTQSAPMVVENSTVRVAKRRKRVKRRKAAKPAPRNDAPAAPDPAAAAPARPAPARAAAPAKQPDALPAAGVRRGPNRIDFDERLIKGQTNKANAIYLFERRSSGMRTLVQKRAHFHREIDDTLR